MTAIVNSEFSVGETWSMDVTCHDSAGNILNLTGASIKWGLALQGDVKLDLSLDNGITLVNAAGGECLITVTPEMQSAAGIALGFYQHQLRVTLADGSVSDQFTGTLKAKPSIF